MDGPSRKDSGIHATAEEERNKACSNKLSQRGRLPYLGKHYRCSRSKTKSAAERRWTVRLIARSATGRTSAAWYSQPARHGISRRGELLRLNRKRPIGRGQTSATRGIVQQKREVNFMGTI